MRGHVLFALLVVLAWLFGAADASAEKRLALVIGVRAYKTLPQLSNTITDAELIGEKLRGAKFDVDVETDPTTAGLKAAVRSFGRKIEAAGPESVALIYYAGHGVQDRKQVNYITGADADLQSDSDLPLEALKIEDLRRTLEEAGPKLLFAIFDACRDDPLPVSSTRGVRRGLAPEVDIPRNVLIAYSTEPGKSADDGPPGGHSPFAAALAEELDAPALESGPMFKLITQKVLDLTKGAQVPWVETQRVTLDFYFHPGSPTSDPVPPPAAAPTAVSAFDAGEIDYGHVVIANDPVAYEEWLRKYPDHPRHPNVMKLLQRLREELLWRRAVAAVSDADKSSAYRTLLEAFPEGVYAEKVKEKLKELDVAQAPPPPPPAPKPTLSPVRRYANTDAPSNDLGDWIANTDVDHCEAACQANPSCVGYTFNLAASGCFPKSRITQLVATTQNALTGVLVDRAPNVSEASPVRRFEGKDAPGNDRGGWLHNVFNEADCELACRNDRGCVGYTYNIQRSICIRKNWIGTPVDSTEPAVTAEFLERSAAPDLRAHPVARLRSYEGMDSWGGDRGAPMRVSIETCADSCTRDSGCAGYVYNRRYLVCILKDQIGNLTPASMPAVTVVVERN